MKCFLKEGDEVVADNIKLEYIDGRFTLPEDGLSHAVKYVFDVETGLEFELFFEINGTEIKPYYDKPVID